MSLACRTRSSKLISSDRLCGLGKPWGSESDKEVRLGKVSLPTYRGGLTLRLVVTEPGEWGGEPLDSVDGDRPAGRMAGSLKAGSPNVSSGYIREDGGVIDLFLEGVSPISTSADTGSDDLGGDGLEARSLPEGRFLSGTPILMELAVTPSSGKPS